MKIPLLFIRDESDGKWRLHGPYNMAGGWEFKDEEEVNLRVHYYLRSDERTGIKRDYAVRTVDLPDN